MNNLLTEIVCWRMCDSKFELSLFQFAPSCQWVFHLWSAIEESQRLSAEEVNNTSWRSRTERKMLCCVTNSAKFIKSLRWTLIEHSLSLWTESFSHDICPWMVVTVLRAIRTLLAVIRTDSSFIIRLVFYFQCTQKFPGRTQTIGIQSSYQSLNRNSLHAFRLLETFCSQKLRH